MSNEITINVEELLKLEDGTITDCETIRQIGLLSCTQNDVGEEDRMKLDRKVNSLFSYAGLYPNTQRSFNILLDEAKAVKSGEVFVIKTPITERYCRPGDVVLLDLERKKIRCGSAWFSFDDRWVVFSV